MGTSRHTSLEIYHQDLGLSKIYSRWVPHILSAEQFQQSKKVGPFWECFRLSQKTFCPNWSQEIRSGSFTLIRIGVESIEWREMGSPLSQKSAQKLVGSIFWDEEGPLLIDYLDYTRTINAQYYCVAAITAFSAIQEPGKFTHFFLFSSYGPNLQELTHPHNSQICHPQIFTYSGI